VDYRAHLRAHYSMPPVNHDERRHVSTRLAALWLRPDAGGTAVAWRTSASCAAASSRTAAAARRASRTCRGGHSCHSMPQGTRRMVSAKSLRSTREGRRPKARAGTRLGGRTRQSSACTGRQSIRQPAHALSPTGTLRHGTARRQTRSLPVLQRHLLC
jgi:hypothetical protein